MARIERDQEQKIRVSCGKATAEVAAARERAVEAGSPEVLNEAAARAWRSYALTLAGALSGEQRQRLAALGATTRH